MRYCDRPGRCLLIAGTSILWIVLLAPLALGLYARIAWGHFLLDYLMPAELFLLVVGGALMLLWGTVRYRRHRAVVAGTLGGAVAALAGSQWLAVAAGFAHGDRAPGGWLWYTILGLLGVYTLAVVALGIMGILIAREARATSAA